MQIIHLTKRADFVSLAKRGSKGVSHGMVLQAFPVDPERCPPEPCIRLGFTVTKQVGNAVIRNRVKRRLRAVARVVLPQCAKLYHDYVIIGRQGTLTRSYAELLGDMRYTLKKAGAYRDNNPSQP